MSPPASQLPVAESQKSAEFFIGWLPAPAGYGRRARQFAVCVIVLSVVLAALLAALQRDPGNGRFDDASEVQLDGYLITQPYPMLCVPGHEDTPWRSVLLVEEGKFGSQDRVTKEAVPDRHAARVRGRLLERDGRKMVELLAGNKGLELLSSDQYSQLRPFSDTSSAPLKEVRVRGEVIDSKCYLGAMRPGDGKTHKACAILCVSGGIPALLVVKNDAVGGRYYLLVSDDGQSATDLIVPFVGDTVEIVGQLDRRGDLDILRVEARGIRRLR